MSKIDPKDPCTSSRECDDPLQADTGGLAGLKAQKADLANTRLSRFASLDLNALDSRILIAPFHPMLESEYFINTDETSYFYEVVYDHILARKSGLHCMGEFRVGKTKAIQNTILRLEKDMPWAAVFFHSAERALHQTKKAFCLALSRSINCPISKRQNPSDCLARYLMTHAVKAGSKTCVIFIDEAQMLTVMQMRYLLEMWNDLRREGFILVTILIGQKDLDSLKQLTTEEDHGAVVARFFVRGIYIGGLHSKEQLFEYLSAFDSKLTYPSESEWTYTRFFCQKAFDAGWRLSSEAGNFWNSLMFQATPSGKTLRLSGFRLAFVNDAIHGFLLDSMKLDKPKFKGSEKMWMEAISSAATNDLLIGS